MKLSRSGRLSGAALVGALALTACGSDNNAGSGTTSSSSGSAPSSSAPQVTGTLNGEGSSAQANAIDEAIASFSTANPGAKVTYNATGSGAGIKQFIAKQADWAGSDSALKTEAADGVVETDAAAERCGGNPAWNLPLVAGPIAIAYNLEGVDKLVLNPSVTAQIFLGKITKWNDPAIAALNNGVQLPDETINVVFRSDESGTTENFAKYLAGSAAQDWTEEPSKVWPGKTGQGAAKSAGVTEAVKGAPGSITYVEWSNAKDAQLGVAQIDNGAGPVELTGETAGKAIGAAEVTGEGNDLRLSLDYATKEAGVYPIVLVTYEIVCSKGNDAAKTPVMKAFLKHLASEQVQQSFAGIGYATIPTEVLTKANTAIDAIS